MTWEAEELRRNTLEMESRVRNAESRAEMATTLQSEAEVQLSEALARIQVNWSLYCVSLAIHHEYSFVPSVYPCCLFSYIVVFFPILWLACWVSDPGGIVRENCMRHSKACCSIRASVGLYSKVWRAMQSET